MGLTNANDNCSARRRIEAMMDEYEWFIRRPPIKPAPQTVFIPKHKEIPLLLDYSGSAPDSWWQHWPKLSWEDGRMIRSSISPVKMVSWALKSNHPDMGTVLEVAEDLKMGCDLGTRGEYLCPSVSTNAASAYLYGDSH